MKRRAVFKLVASVAATNALAQGVPPARKPAEPALMRPIPSSGEQIPVVGLGSWITFNVGNDRAARAQYADVMRAFFNAGGRLIDCSPMYGSSQGVIGDGWVGWAFFWQRYATINWAARYVAFTFWAQAVLLVLLALMPAQHATEKTSTVQRIGWYLTLAGLLIYPLVSAWNGRTWSQMEIFGVPPKPTALVGLGLLFARALRPPQMFVWALAIVPSMSLLLSAATFKAMARA